MGPIGPMGRMGPIGRTPDSESRPLAPPVACLPFVPFVPFVHSSPLVPARTARNIPTRTPGLPASARILPLGRRPALTTWEPPTILTAFFSEGYKNGIEAHVSTEQPPPEADARIPRADAYERRAGGALSPASEGPQAPRGLAGACGTFAVERLHSEALPRERRIARRADFVRIYESGRKVHSRYAVLFFQPNGLEHSRIGITATKKLGKANVRNRAKRWTREAYRRERLPLGLDGAKVDIVVNVKPSAATIAFEEYRRDLARALGRVAAEAAAGRER